MKKILFVFSICWLLFGCTREYDAYFWAEHPSQTPVYVVSDFSGGEIIAFPDAKGSDSIVSKIR